MGRSCRLDRSADDGRARLRHRCAWLRADFAGRSRPGRRPVVRLDRLPACPLVRHRRPDCRPGGCRARAGACRTPARFRRSALHALPADRAGQPCGRLALRQRAAGGARADSSAACRADGNRPGGRSGFPAVHRPAVPALGRAFPGDRRSGGCRPVLGRVSSVAGGDAGLAGRRTGRVVHSVPLLRAPALRAAGGLVDDGSRHAAVPRSGPGCKPHDRAGVSGALLAVLPRPQRPAALVRSAGGCQPLAWRAGRSRRGVQPGAAAI